MTPRHPPTRKRRTKTQSDLGRRLCLSVTVFLSATLLYSSLGCFGSDQVPRHRYYRLPIYERVKATNEPLSVVLRIEEFEVAPAYDHLRLVYRVSPYEVRHYGFRQWVTKPGRLVADALRLYMKMSGRFTTVTEEPRPLADYTLQGKVEVLEEIDKKKRWFAHLVLTLRLVKVSDGRVVWSQRFDTKKRVKKRRPKYVVAGLTELFGQVAEETLKKVVEIVKEDRS